MAHVLVRIGLDVQKIPAEIDFKTPLPSPNIGHLVQLDRDAVLGTLDDPYLIEVIEYAINEGPVNRELRYLLEDCFYNQEPPPVYNWQLVLSDTERKLLPGLKQSAWPYLSGSPVRSD